MTAILRALNALYSLAAIAHADDLRTARKATEEGQ